MKLQSGRAGVETAYVPGPARVQTVEPRTPVLTRRRSTPVAAHQPQHRADNGAVVQLGDRVPH
jgi:hypothetical protein